MTTTTTMAKYGNESTDLLHKFRVDKCNGVIDKRLKDEFIVFDLLKILYDDTVDNYVKTELLIDLEEYGYLSLSSESVDQVITSLLDIVNQHGDSTTNWTFVCQSLITSTSLLIQLDQLETDICKQVIKVLVAIVTNTNHPDNQRLRSCVCHCLIHMEEFQPGLLFAHSDEFSRLARQEKSCVYQDYALLAVKVLENIGSMSLAKLSSPTGFEGDTVTSKQIMVQKQMSFDPQDVRQFSAFLLENIGLMTRCGYFRVVQSISEIVKTFPDVSPMVFKPLMLHQMSTVSCVLFQTIMYLQREFQGEILTEKERAEFLHRLCIMTDHPCLTLLNKLLVSHWAKYYYLDESQAGDSYRSVIQRLRFKFYPSVFDPVDCQLSKLIMTSLCVNKEDDSGLETSVLLGSLGYIHKLAWHTGSSRVAKVMFKALYYMYQRLNNDSFSSDIQRFLRGLCTDLPHFIPHTIDFLDSIQELGISSTIYVETLDLLHKQVVMATEDQIEKSHHFYLQILKKAACEKDISQASSLQFLHNLAERAQSITENSWNLGHRILKICRNFLLYQGTDHYYSDLEDSMQVLKDRKAEITSWGVITIATCAVISCLLIFGLVKIYRMGLVSANHIYIYLTASLIGCFLLCVAVTIGTFLNIFRTYFTKTWHLCFYVEVFKSSSLEWIGACLILTLGDLFYTLIRLTENSIDDFVSQRIFANIFTVASAVILVVINSMTEHSFDDFPNMVSSCSKPFIFLNHVDFWAVLEIAVKSVVVITMLCLIIAVVIVIKHKLKIKGSVESSENGSKICTHSGDIGDDCSKCQSLTLEINSKNCRKHRIDETGVANIGFVPDMDQTTVPWGPVSSSLSQMELARRFSHSTTLDTFVQLSPSHRQKLSVASLDCDHVLYALENFFMIDPAKIQPNMKARLSHSEQSERLIEDETSFSKVPRRRLMSMPGIKLRSKYIKTEDDDKNTYEDEKDQEKADSAKPLEDMIKKRKDVNVNKSKSLDGTVEGHEFTPGKALTSGITVEVVVHGEGYGNLSENCEQDIILMSEDGNDRMGAKNSLSNCYEESIRQRIKFESEIYTGRSTFGSERPEVENVNSDIKADTETGNHLDIDKEFDLLEVPSNEKQLQDIRPDIPEQSQYKETMNTADEIDENVIDEHKKQLKNPAATVEDTVIENLDVDDVSISKKIQTEHLSFKDILKLMGKTTYSIVIVSLVYIVLVLISSCYALVVISGGKERMTNEKNNLFENISDLGQVVVVLFYVIVFEVRFRLFKNRTRK